VWVTSIFAALSMTALLTIVTGHFEATLAALGLAWGGLIFNIDRSIVSSTHTGPLRQRLLIGLPRVFMAIILGLIIAEPLMLWLFRSEINENLAKAHAAAIVEVRDQAEDDAAAELADLETRDATDAKEVATARARVDDLQRRLAAEAHGTGGSGIPGIGNVYEQDLIDLQDARAHLASATATANKDKRAGDKRRAEIREDIEADVTEGSKAILSSNGLLAQEDALGEVMAANSHLWIVRLVLSLGLLIVDVTPALLAIVAKPTAHDRIVDADEETRALLAEAALDDAHTVDADRVAAHRRKVRADLEIERIDLQASNERAGRTERTSDSQRRLKVVAGAAVVALVAFAALGLTRPEETTAKTDAVKNTAVTSTSAVPRPVTALSGEAAIVSKFRTIVQPLLSIEENASSQTLDEACAQVHADLNTQIPPAQLDKAAGAIADGELMSLALTERTAINDLIVACTRGDTTATSKALALARAVDTAFENRTTESLRPASCSPSRSC
jgi:hypothetical protein